MAKLYYWARISETFAIATSRKWSGRRACVDLFASYGVNKDRTDGDLIWGSALLALQVSHPFDTVVLGDTDERATAALAMRVERLGVHGAEVFPLTLGDESLARKITAVKSASPIGPKVVVLTADANEAPAIVRMLLPAFEGKRAVLTMLDPYAANFTWEALSALTFRERMDVLMLFPEEMDIRRNLQHEQRLDRYFGTPDWREVAASSTHVGRALRELYQQRMAKLLDYKLGQTKTIRNSRGVAIYKLIFSSKHPLGLTLWNEGCRENPDGQDALYLPGLD